MLGLGMVMHNPTLAQRGDAGGGEEGGAVVGFTLTAGTLEGGIGYGNDGSGVFGSISREPFQGGPPLLRFNIVPDVYSMVQFGDGDITITPLSGLFPIVDGTPFSGGEWAYQEDGDFSYLLLMGQVFPFVDGGSYAITWGGF